MVPKMVEKSVERWAVSLADQMVNWMVELMVAHLVPRWVACSAAQRDDLSAVMKADYLVDKTVFYWVAWMDENWVVSMGVHLAVSLALY